MKQDRAVIHIYTGRVQELTEDCVCLLYTSDIPYCITEALVNAAKGDMEHALVFCGENAWKCKKIEKVKDIMEEFAQAAYEKGEFS